MIHGLPFNLNFAEDEELIIDMASINFPCDASKQIRSAFIFIRNTNIQATFDFSKCSYEQRVSYLETYMFKNINVNIPILASTWIEILMNSDNIILPSILDRDEIKQFVHDHESDIQEVMELVVSTPIFAMVDYSSFQENPEKKIDCSRFKRTDYHRINFANFARLTENNAFIYLINMNNKPEPKIYTEYLSKHESFVRSKINQNLPYLGIINIMTAPKEIQDKFLNGIKEFYGETDKEATS